MTLEDFEKSLSEARVSPKDDNLKSTSDVKSKKRRKHHHHHSDHHAEGDERHRPKRSRHSKDADKYEDRRSKSPGYEDKKGLTDLGKIPSEEENELIEKPVHDSSSADNINDSPSLRLSTSTELKRDSWMEAPSITDLEFKHRDTSKSAKSIPTGSLRAGFQLKIHENELNKHHLQDFAEGRNIPNSAEIDNKKLGHVDEVAYTFGDAGAQWRMTKLKAIFREVEESGRAVEEVVLERYGDLRAFDDAREEQIELDRRETYGSGYVRKDKPSGELFIERTKEERAMRMEHKNILSSGTEKELRKRREDEFHDQDKVPSNSKVQPIDHTALNRLKAQLLRARLRGTPDVPLQEAEYAKAMDSFTKHQEPDMVVLGAMENRMLTGGRQGEVLGINTLRGRERGLVEENEDMSIEDMVRAERRTRNQAGGDGKRFADRIAKDGKFDTGLEYMEENANKLARRVQKSEITLKNIAISDFQKMNRILDRCPLCHREDEGTPPIAPIVSLATRVYLTLPTEPEMSDGGAVIVPIQHRRNLLECDDDEWEEIRNFMKCLTRMYHDQGRDVIFYENAAEPRRHKHAGMEVVPLPYSLGETASAFFKEAIMSADEEWTQHKKIIDTLSKAKQGGLGKLAVRRTLVKEMPYFHVWFDIDGGLGHIVEDANRWPKGDLFAREVIGGMLNKGPDVVKKQGRWTKGSDRRVDGFRKRWKKFDWTKVLTDT